jgi:hypothetical protein
MLMREKKNRPMAEEVQAPDASLFRSMKLTLDSAELALLMSALELDPTPFIADSPLTSLDGPVLARSVANARRSVINRQLAQALPDRGVVPASPVKDLLVRASNAHTALSACKDGDCSARNPAHMQQLQESGSATSTCLHITSDPLSIVVHQRLAGGVHAISVDRYTREQLADKAYALAGLQEFPGIGVQPPFEAAAALMPVLAYLPAQSEQLVLVTLASASCADAQLRTFTRAVMRACAFGCVSGRSGQRRWLTDGESLWMYWPLADTGAIHIQQADASLFKQHVRAIA